MAEVQSVMVADVAAQVRDGQLADSCVRRSRWSPAS